MFLCFFLSSIFHIFLPLLCIQSNGINLIMKKTHVNSSKFKLALVARLQRVFSSFFENNINITKSKHYLQSIYTCRRYKAAVYCICHPHKLYHFIAEFSRCPQYPLRCQWTLFVNKFNFNCPPNTSPLLKYRAKIFVSRFECMMLFSLNSH